MQLLGKVALVTGGSKGIGKEVCILLRSHGLKICIADIDSTEGYATLKELQVKYNDPKAVIFQKVDVTNEEEYENAMITTKSTFGRLDVVINNAGVLLNDWRTMMNVNLHGVIIGSHLAFKHLSNDKGTKEGTMIINTASIMGIEASHMAPSYCASKHACVGWTKCWGHPTNVEKTGVKMNAVCPDVVNTTLFQYLNNDEESEFKLSDFPKDAEEKMIPLEKVAHAYLQLLKEEVTGQLLVIRKDKEFFYSPYNTYF